MSSTWHYIVFDPKCFTKGSLVSLSVRGSFNKFQVCEYFSHKTL